MFLAVLSNDDTKSFVQDGSTNVEEAYIDFAASAEHFPSIWQVFFWQHFYEIMQIFT